MSRRAAEPPSRRAVQPSRRAAEPPSRPAVTLWTQASDLDPRVLDFTVGDDRYWDSHLLRFDVLGSLGHIEGLRESGLLTSRDHARLRAGLRRALRAIDTGRLVIGADQEDAHSAVEHWLTRRIGTAGERLHTGRSRNDQIACDVRLFLKDRLSMIGYGALSTVAGLLEFAARHRKVLWPGYTHTRRAMPSSAGLWAGAFAEGLLDTLEGLPALWEQLDRSPLGSAAGYGTPLPIDRVRVARALGFGDVEGNVAAVQNGRGKLEGAALFWCAQLGHDLSRFAADVILWSAEEYGWLRLPAALTTGSSIMPQKRNPDLLELARARTAALEGDLAAVLALRARLTSGYHRDFQLLKEPLIRGLGRTLELFGIAGLVIPRLEVDPVRARKAVGGDLLATDEVLRRVEAGTPFRRAYRDVAAALGRGDPIPVPSPARVMARRQGQGGLGNLGLPAAWKRWRAVERWLERERSRFDTAMARLAGGRRGTGR
jgi:argininosuccinate lyase